jgi:hypothetical protein
MTAQISTRSRMDLELFNVPATGSRFSRPVITDTIPSCEANWTPLVASASLRPTRVCWREDYGLNLQPARQLRATNLVHIDTIARSFSPDFTLRWLNFPESTSPFSTATEALAPRQAGEKTVLISEILLRLRAHFSLNTSELARVLGVERPTIYAWSKESVALRKQHRARLVALDRLVRFWTRLSPRPLGQLKDANVGDRRFLELLADTSVSENTICEALQALARHASVEKRQVRQRSIAEIAEDRGWPKVSPEQAEQTLRSLRGT